MPLTFDYTHILNHDELCHREGRVTPVTWTLTMATMFVQLGTLTEQNAEEFFRRLSLWETLHGALLGTSDGPRYLTLRDIKAHVGLRTNVPNVGRREWDAYFKGVCLQHCIERTARRLRS